MQNLGGEKFVVNLRNITNCYMIGIEIHITNNQNQQSRLARTNII